ncbi:chitinase-3-like protein 2 [Phlebotomus papatasi]|uniref:chitinase-3-like protein 2 n=1 Tax=Phlebotomus papatasi TaxID=29031 RepID=UPI00248424B3|nr:chitinase-3-like protein 2 [Phlebotomus papatasi]XP_055713444.1 chitinase-3-like protein 2 [Phlebotomus papatasi]XP_055713445.1 chitinase-3-like protein 2 [Phlebotomus papatasi]
MSQQQVKYELLEGQRENRLKYSSYLQVTLLILLCAVSSVTVYTTWTIIYRNSFNYPPKLFDVPKLWIHRTELYSQYLSDYSVPETHNATNGTDSALESAQRSPVGVKELDNERISPSRYGNFIPGAASGKKKLVCYYTAPYDVINGRELLAKDIDPHLCTHINVGFAGVVNNSLFLDDVLRETFVKVTALKKINQELKILVWTGGMDSGGFSEMVKDHASRKHFIQSVKSVLETYRLDGIDLDWEFPGGFDRQRQHFSQLLHEIRREYQREHRTYLLTVAVAAPRPIIDVAYDVGEINSYADFINVMTYDYHFYAPSTPFTGINAPLFPRENEKGLLGMLNINYTANYWLERGMDKDKIVIGLPTYGHSFRLANPLNRHIGSPSTANGATGVLGFTSYSEVCWFQQNNIFVTTVYDNATCSPYTTAGTEWISYDDVVSLECKTKWVKDSDFGGVMIYSLNADDHGLYCRRQGDALVKQETFPLSRKIHSVLFSNFSTTGN